MYLVFILGIFIYVSISDALQSLATIKTCVQ